MTRIVIDACVLFPTVLREIVLGVAREGAFEPLWSERILEEWRRAALRHDGLAIAESEIAVAKAQFPNAIIGVSEQIPDNLALPDPNDVHVLEAAIVGKADELLTLNLKDFPTRILSAQGIVRRDPDGLLLELWHRTPDVVVSVVNATLARAKEHGIDTANPRALLKRARLPRLAKALFQD